MQCNPLPLFHLTSFPLSSPLYAPCFSSALHFLFIYLCFLPCGLFISHIKPGLNPSPAFLPHPKHLHHHSRLTFPPLFFQANLAVQQNRLAIANTDLQKAQAELDAKQAELDVVQADYEKAMTEKQVSQRRLVIFPTRYAKLRGRTITPSGCARSMSMTCTWQLQQESFITAKWRAALKGSDSWEVAWGAGEQDTDFQMTLEPIRLTRSSQPAPMSLQYGGPVISMELLIQCV